MKKGENLLLKAMLANADPEQVAGLSRFFKTGKGQYGEGDHFLGIKVPVTRQTVKELWEGTAWNHLEECICSEYHEVRLAALLTLVQKFQHAKKVPEVQRQCIEFYLKHTKYINNWDLVDLSCYLLLGAWLMDKPRDILYQLAKSKNMWEQRIAIVSTMQFVRAGELDDTFALAEQLLEHPHDLMHKAVGWLLREAGKHNRERLKDFLQTNYSRMARTTLRYAIEHFPEEERKQWLRFCPPNNNHTKKKR